VGDDQPTFSDFQVFKVRRTYYAMVAETDFLLGQVKRVAGASFFFE
jgi:hypothetical protein